MVDKGLREHILGIIFFSVLSTVISFIMITTLVFFVTDSNGFQEHVGECAIASAIATLGWFHQLGQQVTIQSSN
jgi:hypothetical protein